ncbi:hypothetical protein CAEBREN_06655 [Caenorhabditis brenneri]|uniref:T20D4.11-like domain-containing protein n=1 Tax=Caenorhabditis brenneri TaxID=135651 RepID=G0NL87_CAEBE|nr:hypothetical protein CAEBREN_06655 [Caenorhabditis brenneri]
MPIKCFFLLSFVFIYSESRYRFLEKDQNHGNCTGLVNEYNNLTDYFTNKVVTEEGFQKNVELCEELKVKLFIRTYCFIEELFQSCFNWLESNFELNLFAYKEEVFQGLCENFDIYVSGVLDCYGKVVEEILYGEPECSKNYKFLTTYLTLKNDAYTTGKSCFLKLTVEQCAPSAVLTLKNEFIYQKFVRILSHTLTTNYSQDIGQLFRAKECESMKLAVDRKKNFVNWAKVEVDDPEVLIVSQMYDETNSCFKSIPSLAKKANQFQRELDWFSVHNTHFYKCIVKLSIDPSLLSGFTCLEDHDFNNGGTTDSCIRYTDLKGCTKKVLFESCGEKAVKNFDQTVKAILNHLHCEYVLLHRDWPIGKRP